jgi:hypothetical protein
VAPENIPGGKIWGKFLVRAGLEAARGGTMAAKRMGNQTERPRRPPGTTPEARENQLISAAVDLAERQLRDGTASSQVITHYLKLGSSREKLEQERLRHENELMQAKAEMLASQKRVEDLYAKALDAMRSYAGQVEPEESEDYDYE